MDGHTRNLQNIKDRHADQPAKNHATPCRIHMVLPLLNRHCWKTTHLKNIYMDMKEVLYDVTKRIVIS
jgi:hypothetical protein